MKHDLFTMLTVASLTSFSSSLLAVEAVHFTQDEIDAKETALTDFPLMRAVKSSIATRDNRIVERVTAGNVNNPANVKRLESIVSEVQFEFLFPVRADEYTYQGLLRAAAKFPALCGDYDEGDADAICRQSLATMFAHFAQETGAHDKWLPEPQWRQGLYWVREMGWDETKQGGTTLSVIQIVGRVKYGPVVNLPMVNIRAISDVVLNSFLIITTTVPFLMPCLVM